MDRRKKQVNEGRLKDLIDSIIYSIFDGINNTLISSLKDDPEIEQAMKDFEEAKNDLESALQDFADNPEKYIDEDAKRKIRMENRKKK